MTFAGQDVIMTETISVAETKRRFSDLIERVLAGEHFVVTRRGRPVMALVPADEETTGAKPTYLGLAAFAGALEDFPEFADVMAEVIASRQTAGHRPPPDFGLD